MCVCVCVFLCVLNKLLKKSSKFLLCLIPFYSIQKCFCITENGEVYWGGHFDILLSQMESVCCSMSRSNCCCLICIQISQEAEKMVWCSHLFKNFPKFLVIHTVKGFGVISRRKCFSGILLLLL